ncbi:ATP-binding protein [Candidatus Aerophobetes bacterium]|nr:ATP-binding protein [Candidatus Aerophobetes bacterium]
MILSVASGKGGTGKTTVATSLALSLDTDVQFLDCDVEAPNAYIFLKPLIVEKKPVYFSLPRLIEEKCSFCGLCSKVCEWNAIAVVNKKWLLFPELCHSCGACWQLCPEEALEKKGKELGVVEKGEAGKIDFAQGKLTIGQAISPLVIKAVKKEISPLKDVIIDVSPGTACSMVETVKGTDFCILVTEPTPFGFNDLVLAAGVLNELSIPCGVVINRYDVDYDKINNFCEKNKIPILARIPLDKKIAEAYSRGELFVSFDETWKKKFKQLFLNIKKKVKK